MLFRATVNQVGNVEKNPWDRKKSVQRQDSAPCCLDLRYADARQLPQGQDSPGGRTGHTGREGKTEGKTEFGIQKGKAKNTGAVEK